MLQHGGPVCACCKSPHLQYGDVPREALHRLVQLPALQPFLQGQVVEVLVKFHGWARKADEKCHSLWLKIMELCETDERLRGGCGLGDVTGC